MSAMEMKMANEPAKKLNLNDPIGKEALDKLAELEAAEVNTALNIKALRQEEIKLLAADRRIQDERTRLFQKLLMDRGLAPNTPAQIDRETGRIVPMPQQPVEQVEQPGAQAAPPAPPPPPPAPPEPPPPNGQA